MCTTAPHAPDAENSAASGSCYNGTRTFFKGSRCKRSNPPALIHLVTARRQASGHRAIVVAAAAIRIAGRHSPARLSRIEAGLALRPAMALELIGRLLILALAVFRINDQIALRIVGGRRR